MDYAVPAILFAVGFAAALFASGFWKWSLRIRKGDGLPVEGGAVRLDMVGKGRQKVRMTKNGSAPGEDPAELSSSANAPGSASARKLRHGGRR